MIRSASAAALLAALAAVPPIALAQAGSGDARTMTAEAPALTYADLVTLADGAPLVIHAQVRRQAVVEPERAPGLAPGHARLYVQAETRSLLSGVVPVGESLRYLADVPLTARGKVPRFAKRDVASLGGDPWVVLDFARSQKTLSLRSMPSGKRSDSRALPERPDERPGPPPG